MRELERELNSKEKALAGTVALLTLSKKTSHIEATRRLLKTPRPQREIY